MDKDSAANYVDVQKLTLVAAFNQVAMAMRECASQAELFAQSIGNLPAGGNVNPQTLQLLTAAMNAMPRTNTFPHMAQAMFQLPTTGNTNADSTPDAKGKGKRVRGAAAKKKAERDPNKPKRPASAYLMFQNVVRKDIAGQHPGLPYHEVLAKISEQWASLSDEDKEPYREATRQAKGKYDALKAEYDATLGPNGEIPAPSSPVAPESPVVPAAKTPKTAKAAPVVAEESADEGSEGGSDEDDDDEEQEEAQPTRKKQKATPPPPPVVPEKKAKVLKEKKTKKA